MNRTLALTACAVLIGCDDAHPAASDAADVTVTDAAVTDAAVTDVDVAATQCGYDGGVDDVPEPPRHTPRWAFEPWISKDISDGADTRAFVQGFRSRDIPVGVVVLDSPWETQYNTMVPSPTRYPNFAAMVTELHAQDIRLVLWITPLVNQSSYDVEMGGDTYVGPSPNLAEGQRCDFFVDDGNTFNWWKGRGAAVDFFNPRAVAWWHRQQDLVLDAGIDGWKLDFGESYITSDPVSTAMGMVPHQRYSEAYYRDYLAYGVQRRGRDFVTMVRPWDESYQFAGRFFARKEHAPVAWVGDNRRDWVGLVDALDEIFRSAAAGYVMLGSDVGGYLDRDDHDLTMAIPFSQDTFARWTAVGALSPFMQLHGRANLAPWTVPERADETVTLYRYWATLHRAMVPFYYALAEEAYAGTSTIVRPIGAMASWAGDYRYTLGDALLVAPVLDGSGRRDVALPEGAWFDWWNLAGDPITGGRTLTAVDTSNRARIPLYVRRGAIIPLRVESDLLGFGTAAQARALTLLVFPDAQMSRFVLHENDVAGAVTVTGGDTPTITLPPLTTECFVRVRAPTAPTAVTVDGAAITAQTSRAALDAGTSGWWYDATQRALWVRLPMATAMRSLRVGS